MAIYIVPFFLQLDIIISWHWPSRYIQYQNDVRFTCLGLSDVTQSDLINTKLEYESLNIGAVELLSWTSIGICKAKNTRFFLFVSPSALHWFVVWRHIVLSSIPKRSGAWLVTARKRSLGQGNIFTPVCHSVHKGGGVSQHALQVVSQHALQQGGAWSRGSAPGGCLVWGSAPKGGGAWSGGVCSQGECLVWGGLLHEGGTWSGGGWWCLVETPRTATAAGGTHPTGMHSCNTYISKSESLKKIAYFPSFVHLMAFSKSILAQITKIFRENVIGFQLIKFKYGSRNHTFSCALIVVLPPKQIRSMFKQSMKSSEIQIF